MAIEGGCGWIVLSDSLPEGENLRDTAVSIQEMCRENDVILTIKHDVELVNDLKVFGVLLSKSDMIPQEAREMLGPHAIIGVEVDNPDDVIVMQAADIDYVVVGPYGERFDVNDYRVFVNSLTERGCKIAVVASGNIGVDDIQPLLSAGVRGVAISEAIIKSDNPVEMVRAILAKSSD